MGCFDFSWNFELTYFQLKLSPISWDFFKLSNSRFLGLWIFSQMKVTSIQRILFSPYYQEWWWKFLKLSHSHSLVYLSNFNSLELTYPFVKKKTLQNKIRNFSITIQLVTSIPDLANVVMFIARFRVMRRTHSKQMKQIIL